MKITSPESDTPRQNYQCITCAPDSYHSQDSLSNHLGPRLPVKCSDTGASICYELFQRNGTLADRLRAEPHNQPASKDNLLRQRPGSGSAWSCLGLIALCPPRKYAPGGAAAT